jgi:hypothetical protein
VTRNEVTKPTAALATPSRGSPIQPLISAGVTMRPTMVETTSANSGVSVSPTPRMIEVSSRNAKNPGMANRQMRE